METKNYMVERSGGDRRRRRGQSSVSSVRKMGVGRKDLVYTVKLWLQVE